MAHDFSMKHELLPPRNGPKILVLDVETSQLVVKTWGIRKQFISHEQIVQGRHLLSFTAKWYKQRRMIYMDQRNKRDITDDTDMLEVLWDLLDQADIVVSKNGQRFDLPVIFARFLQMRIRNRKPPSPFKHHDTELMGVKFGFESHKLDYVTQEVNDRYTKSKHGKYAGRTLWEECEAGNLAAWNEMRRYNRRDVLATEEYYTIIAPWGVPGNMNVFTKDLEHSCKWCMSKLLQYRGTGSNDNGIYRKYVCKKCGKWGQETGQANNLLSKKKIRSLKGRN